MMAHIITFKSTTSKNACTFILLHLSFTKVVNKVNLCILLESHYAT